eukprot:IDg14377t1
MNSPASFQRALDFILSRYKWKTCLVYLEDAIMFSASVAEHVEHFHVVLNALKAAGISLKIDKYTEKAQPLYELLKEASSKELPELSLEQEAAFHILIEALLDLKTLAIPLPGLTY